jgi:homoserine dehydrogenase
MSETNTKCGVALVGCGVVGGATATLLTRDSEILRGRCGTRIDLRYIVDLDHTHARELGLDESLLTADLTAALDDPDVQVVIELVGGITTAREITEQALRAGKHVVTANKALLAHAGPELYAVARENGVSIAFEASCAGGIPIIRALTDGLIVNRIDALYGIVNGTCNFILSAMVQEGKGYDRVLAQAQADGLAEADPTLDVSGEDSAHKLTILAGLAFGQNVDFDAVSIEGIDKLQLMDIQQGKALGYVIKLLAIAQRQGDGLCLRVRPVFIDIEHPLAWVSGPFNAVSVYGHATGHTMYYGRGAGGMPTASAVVADVVSVAQGLWPKLFAQLALWPDRCESANQLPIEEVRSRYYIRMLVEDRPGVFAQIGRVFAEEEISIASLLQPEVEETPSDDLATIVITTHVSREGAVRSALARCGELPTVRARPVCIGIVDEHPEQLWAEGEQQE